MEQRDLVLLQERFGIGAMEALHVRPAWEIDNLLAYLQAERERADREDARTEMMTEHQEKLRRLGVG